MQYVEINILIDETQANYLCCFSYRPELYKTQMNLGRELSEQERAWIRLMEHPYAALSLREPNDDDAMISRKETLQSAAKESLERISEENPE